MTKWRANIWKSKRHLLMIICMITSVLMMVCALEGSGLRTISRISRPELSEGTRMETMVVVREAGEEVPLSLYVKAKYLTASEAEPVLADTMERLPEMIKADNVSLDQVKTDLTLPVTLEDRGIQLQWKSRNPGLLDHRGRLNDDREMTGPETVVLETVMTLQEYSFEGEIPVTVWPQDAPSWEERLRLELESVEQHSREESTLLLPEYFEGEKIQFGAIEDRSKNVALALVPMIAGLIILNGGTGREDKLQRKRRDEIAADYPELIIKMTVLYQAGLSMRGVWERIAADARKKGGKMRPIYEEVCFACNCMAEGISEQEVYRQFGHRCSTGSCLKLGNLLAGNVRRGTKQLSALMAQESARAWEIRKHRARRDGEKAGTKMLIPMFMMFAVVLTMVVIPAFYSFMI